MQIDAIIQCRYSSSRLPGKILLPISQNYSSLKLLIENLKLIKEINKIIITVPQDCKKKFFSKVAKENKVSFIAPKCDSMNVLKRFYLSSKKFKSKNILRITSDCPFSNIYIIKKMIKYYFKNQLSFLTNNKPRYVPHGFDCEIFSFKTLEKIYKNAKIKNEKEHVTMWYYKNKFSKRNQLNIYKKNFSNFRITLDYLEDYIYFVKNFKKLFRLSRSKNHQKILRGILDN